MPKIIQDTDVFKAVIQVVVTNGYEKATIDEMAEAAGIHHATLFRKYGNKDQLIEQSITTLLSTAPLSQVVYTGSLEEDLESILSAYLATADMYGAIIPMLLFEIPRYPQLQKAIEAPMSNIGLVIDIILRYQKEGSLIVEPPTQTIASLIGPLIAHQMFDYSRIGMQKTEVDLTGYLKSFLEGRRK